MNLSYFLTVTALALGVISSQAQSTTLNTVPEGVITYTFAATGVGQTSVNYYSAPLLSDPVYTGAVSAVTTNTISVADNPAPFVNTSGGTQLANLATPAAPYFVKFLSGLQTGRVLLVTANTTNTLTLDTTDHTAQTVPLTTSGFAVAVNDSFEVFAGDTLATLFGINTSGSPLVLKGGTTVLNADSVGLYSPILGKFQAYYFNTTNGFWSQSGSTANFNNVVVYPYSTFSVARRASEAASSLVLMGRVAEVSRLVKVTGSNAASYDSTGYPVDMPLSSLVLGPNWTKGTSILNADTLAVWNNVLGRFDSYFQMTDSTWRKTGGGSTDQSSFVIPAGTTVSYVKRAAASGATSFLQPALPYTY